jgi:cytochrome b
MSEARQSAEKRLVWDLPVRVFHVVFGSAFLGAYLIANTLDDESPDFSAHMLLGLLVGVVALLRVTWGFLGTKYARFRNLSLSPVALFRYMHDALTRSPSRHVGHNPAASLALLAMLALAFGLMLTGIMLGRGDGSVEEVHELFAHLFLAVVIIHILGVILHTLFTQENIAMSMVDGRKQVTSAEAIPGSRPLVGALFLVLVGFAGAWLWANFDETTRRINLPLIGALTLGESEYPADQERRDSDDERHDDAHRHDDDDD